MKISPARTAAFDVLLRIERDRAFSSVILPQVEETLDERNRALCHTLVLGTLRRQLYLDHAIKQLTGSKRLDVEVVVALRLGLFQILELDRIPTHSAVNESVSLVQRARKTSAKGLVNAVLRKAASEGVASINASGIEAIALQTSHPKWLLERWVSQYGEGRAFAIAEANNQPGKMSFRVTARGESAGFERSTHLARCSLSGSAFIIDRLSEELREAASSGYIYFQDAASQMIAESVKVRSDGSILDVCAAPGGKTSLIASRNGEARIVAGDIHLHRVDLIREICARQGVGNVLAVQYDAVDALPFADESFEAVLVDAPCSGTGTIRSNPEIRYFLAPEDIQAFHLKQLAILKNASKLLKRGGVLTYSTCSLEREENEDVVEAFRSGSPGFEPVVDVFPERLRREDGSIRTFPDVDDADGFFAISLKRL